MIIRYTQMEIPNLDTTNIDLFILKWKIYYKVKKYCDVTLLAHEIILDFKLDVTSQEKAIIDTIVVEDNSTLQFAHKISIKWDINKILQDALNAGYDMMYLGKNEGDYNSANFYFFNQLTQNDKTTILNYLKNLFTIENG